MPSPAYAFCPAHLIVYDHFRPPYIAIDRRSTTHLGDCISITDDTSRNTTMSLPACEALPARTTGAFWYAGFSIGIQTHVISILLHLPIYVTALARIDLDRTLSQIRDFQLSISWYFHRIIPSTDIEYLRPSVRACSPVELFCFVVRHI